MAARRLRGKEAAKSTYLSIKYRDDGIVLCRETRPEAAILDEMCVLREGV